MPFKDEEKRRKYYAERYKQKRLFPLPSNNSIEAQCFRLLIKTPLTLDQLRKRIKREDLTNPTLTSMLRRLREPHFGSHELDVVDTVPHTKYKNARVSVYKVKPNSQWSKSIKSYEKHARAIK